MLVVHADHRKPMPMFFFTTSDRPNMIWITESVLLWTHEHKGLVIHLNLGSEQVKWWIKNHTACVYPMFLWLFEIL